MRQELNSEQVDKQVRATVDDVLFKDSEIATGWRFGDRIKKKGSREGDEEQLKTSFEVLVDWVPFRHTAQITEVLLWAPLFSVVLLLV